MSALFEAQLNARNVGNRGVVAHARLGAEDLSVPGLALGYGGLRQEEVDMLMPDRDVLVLVFQNFDSQPTVRQSFGEFVRSICFVPKNKDTACANFALDRLQVKAAANARHFTNRVMMHLASRSLLASTTRLNSVP
jgi:hypothetical protein